MKKYLVVLALLGFLFVTKSASADMAPEPPNCTQSQPPTCGIIRIQASFSLGTFNNQYVLIENSPIGDGPGNQYDVIAGDVPITFSRFPSSYQAVDKIYFDQQGGLSGIFNTTNTDAGFQDNSGNEVYGSVMAPKNVTEYNTHAHDFLVSSDDQFLYLDFPSQANIPNQYVAMPDEPEMTLETPHSECTDSVDFRPGDTAGTVDCSVVVKYQPQSLVNGNLVMVPVSTVYTPSYIAPGAIQATPAPAAQTTSTNTVLPSNPISVAQQPIVAQASAWHRFWSSVKSFFSRIKSIF